MNRSLSFAIFFLGFFVVFVLSSALFNSTVLAPDAEYLQSLQYSDGSVASESSSAAVLSQEPANASTQSAFILETPPPAGGPTSTPLSVQETPRPTDDQPVAEVPQGSSDSLLGVVNAYRGTNGKSSLSAHGGLCAYLHGRESDIQNGVHGNLSADVFATYCPECTNLAENIARGYSSDTDVLNAWLASGSHKANIEGDWNYGCTVRFGEATAMMFGR